MLSSKPIIGFSTGAIAKGDFRHALELLRNAQVPAVELSALREHELPELMNALVNLDLHDFAYRSIHAPSNYSVLDERQLVDLLKTAIPLRLPIILHPDMLRTPELWKPFGVLLLIENMDKRRPIGRTASELRRLFKPLPEAGLCFDIAHARQVDPSMIETVQILSEFRGCLREVHASGVSTRSTHGPISNEASLAYRSVAHLISEEVPIILESPVGESEIRDELNFAWAAFSPWFEILRTDIDDVLDIRIESSRKTQAENFFKVLQSTHVRLTDFENVINHLPTGAAFGVGEIFLTTRALLHKLSDEQKIELRNYLLRRVRSLVEEYPEFRLRFEEQFAGV